MQRSAYAFREAAPLLVNGRMSSPELSTTSGGGGTGTYGMLRIGVCAMNKKVSRFALRVTSLRTHKHEHK